MITVPLDPISNITPPPIREESAAVIVRRFLVPAVKNFVHDQNTHSVAQVIKRRQLRIVRCANGIATHVLELLQATFQQRFRHGRADRAAALMLAHAQELNWLAIQEKPIVGVEAQDCSTPAESGAPR